MRSNMNSRTEIDTQDAGRIAKRLVNHWKHKFKIEEHGTAFTIVMPDAKVILTPETEQLAVQVESQRAEDEHQRLEKVVIDHLNRMAQQEFQAQWRAY